MDRELVAGFRIEPPAATPGFDRRAGWEQVGLACECGRSAFRIVGWPCGGMGPGGMGRGGVLWQTFSRAFRETRAVLRNAAADQPMFELPLSATCEACGREIVLLDDPRVPGRMPIEHRRLPRESYRCRVCRRGAVSIGIAFCEGAPPRGGAAVEVHVDCLACRRTARIAAVDSRASEQQQRLDRLYGRS